MDLARCIAAEMRFQDHALSRELSEWQTRTMEEPAFKVHRSQIVRICRALDSARQELGMDALSGDEVDDRDALFRNLNRQRQHLHALHTLWNFFRHKLLQRMQTSFQTFLLFADDLAWACYGPCLAEMRGQAEGLREPPLTFLSMEPAPFAQSRRSSFLPPGLSALERKLLYASLRRMPVPVIGLPWLHIGHFPDLILVGHETAHVVADDLALEQEFAPLIAGIGEIPEDRRAHWRAWLDEVFADIFGFLVGGAGFGFGLVRALAGDAGVILAEKADPKGAYPPRRVRMAVARATAEHLGLDTAFAATWENEYGPVSAPHAPDIEPLVAAVLAHPFTRVGGKTLAQLLAPPATERVDAYLDMLIDESSPSGLLDIRAATSAAAIAHARKPEIWDNQDADDSGPRARLIDHFLRSRDDGYRDEDRRSVKLRHLDERDADLYSARMRHEDHDIGQNIAALFAAETTEKNPT